MRTIIVLTIGALAILAGCATVTAPSNAGSPAPFASAAPGEAESEGPLLPTAEEARLFAGLRVDLTGLCAPVRADLAEKALALVDCRPQSDVVEHVSVSLFSTEQDMLSTYLARLAAHGMAPRTGTGRCVDRPTEGAYMPGDGGPDLVPVRSGCYRDDTGKAHFTATIEPFVLIEVDGVGGDLAGVENWAWRGNQDVPGAPTVWRAEGPSGTEK